MRSILTFGCRVLGAVLALCVALFITNSLSQVEAGKYFYMYSLVVFLGTIVCLGLNTAVAKMVAVSTSIGEVRARTIPMVRLILLAGSIVSLSLYGISVCSRHLNIESLISENMIAYVCLAVPGYALLCFFSGLAQGRGRPVLSIAVLYTLPQLVLLSLLWLLDIKYAHSAVAVALISILVSAILVKIFVRKDFTGVFKARVSRRQYSDALEMGIPLTTSILFAQASVFSINFFLDIFSTPEAISSYAVSLRVGVIMTFVVVAVNRVYAPQFATLYESKKYNELSELVRSINTKLFILSTFAICAIFLLGRLLLSMFGESYQDGFPGLLLISFGQLIATSGGTYHSLLNMTGQHRTFRNNVILSGLITIISGAFLIPTFDMVGAAATYAVSLVCITLLNAIAVRYFFRTIQN